MLVSRKYGPQTSEILKILAEIKDPANKDVVEAVRSNAMGNRFRMFGEIREMMFGESNTVSSVAKKAGRGRKFMAAFTGGAGQGQHMGYALGALAIRDLVGGTFTQEQYDRITQPTTNLLVILHGTEAGSVHRELACSLMAGGLDGRQALTAANGALIL